MYNSAKRREIDKIYHSYGIDNSDVVEVSKWYCAAQWTFSQTDGKIDCLENVRAHVLTKVFREICGILRLHIFEVQLENSSRMIFDLCQFIKDYRMFRGSAKFFYQDYLSCTVSDTSLFADPGKISADTTVSCTLIHLCLVYAGSSLGRAEIFSFKPSEVYKANESDLTFLGVSYEDFARYWYAVHCLEATSPMRERKKINDAVRAYSKMKAPRSALLSQYALARRFDSDELRTTANPWEYCQRSSDGVIQEKGMSIDEKLFNEAAYRISRENPADVIQGVFYKDRDDSRNESAMDRSEVKRLTRAVRNTLVVNPSPAFLVELNKCLSLNMDGRKNAAVPNFTFSVNDEQVAYIYGQQFPQFHFVLNAELDVYDSEFDHVVILARDYETAMLWHALSRCKEKGYITLLVPQSTITLADDNLFDALIENKIYVNWIMDVPTVLSESGPRKKMLLSGRKGEDFSNTIMQLIFASTDQKGEWIVPHKQGIVVPMDMLSKRMTLAQMRTVMNRAKMNGQLSAEQKDSLVYDFSREIKICYNFIVKSGKVEAARAYYRNILRPDSGTTSKKGKRANEYRTERGLRGKTKDEIIPKLEFVPFYDEYFDDIVSDIKDYYKEDQSRLTVKTMWFCCRNALLSRISYDEELAMKLFCGENQILSDLISGGCTIESLVKAVEALCGENEAGKAEWLQLYLIFQVAVEEGMIEKNPLVPFVHVVREENKKKLYMLNAALKKGHFTDREETRILEYLCEKIPLRDHKGTLVPRYVAESKWLAGAFSLFAGLPVREICPLLWSDLHYLDDEETMQIYITKHLNRNDEVISNVNYGNKAHYRKVPLDVNLARMLLLRKRFLMEQYGLSEDAISEIPIMLETESAGRGRKKRSMISRNSALAVNRQLLSAAQIPDDLVSLLEGDAQFDVNLNAYRNDLFASNFRHKAYHVCGFSAGELSYYVGNKGSDTFARHYCDYGNDFLQYDMAKKLYRWTFRHDSANDVSDAFCTEETIAGEKEYATGRFSQGRANVSLTLKPTLQAEGIVRVEIECEHGLNGTVISFCKGDPK